MISHGFNLEDIKLTSFLEDNNWTFEIPVSCDSHLDVIGGELTVVCETTDEAAKPTFAFLVDGWEVGFKDLGPHSCVGWVL